MKKSIFFLLCASMGLVATAQTINKENLIDECQRLYSDGEYTTALSLLERLDIEKLDKEKKQEAEQKELEDMAYNYAVDNSVCIRVFRVEKQAATEVVSVDV